MATTIIENAAKDNVTVTHVDNVTSIQTCENQESSSAESWINSTGQPHVSNTDIHLNEQQHAALQFDVNNKTDYLRKDGVFAPPPSGGGISNAPIYLSNAASDVSGYKKLSYTPDASETLKTITATNAKVYGEKYILDTPIGISEINAGQWIIDYWRAINSAAGDSFLGMETFLRHSDGSETVTYSLESPSIENTTLEQRTAPYSLGVFPTLPTDRFGLTIFLRTTRNAPTTLSYPVGGARAFNLTVPVPPNHDVLRNKDANPDYNHLNNNQKFNGGLATGNANLPTVKDVTNITDKYVCSEEVNVDYDISVVSTSIAGWSVIPYKGDGRYVNVKFMPKATTVEYAVVDWNGVTGNTGSVVTQFSDIYYKDCTIGVADEITDFLLPDGKYLAIKGCGYSSNVDHKIFEYFQSFTSPFYTSQYGLAVYFTYINKGVIFSKVSDLIGLNSRITDIVVSDKDYNLIANSFGLSYTSTYDSVSGLVDIVPNPYSSTGSLYLTYIDRRVNDIVHVKQNANGWMVFAANDQYAYIINQNGTQVAPIYLATGGLEGIITVSGYNISTLIGKDFYILNTPTSVDIYLSNKVLWVSIPKSLIRYSTPSFGAVAHQSVTGSHWYCNIIGAFSRNANASSRLNYDSIQSVDTEAEVLVTSKFLPNGIAKMPLSSATIGKTIQLYGDSISSTDYSWYKDYLHKYTGSIVYNDGFSGYATRQLSSNYCYQKVVDRLPNYILYLVGGNDTGASGTIGTFDASSPNGVLGESIVSESDISQDFCTDGLHLANNNYQSLYFVVAISHFIRKWKAQYYDFRANAGLTGSETEAEKKAKLDAAYKPRLILCTTLPQQRNNSSDAFSIPLNWQRKINAVKECAKKYNVDIIDFSELYQIDMAIEPYWVAPTSTTNNMGTYTMDGLHPNEYGYAKLAKLISEYLKRF